MTDQPYIYEGKELHINNPYTGVRINRIGTTNHFNFNLPGSFLPSKPPQNFTTFYDLYTYYTQNTTKTLARVHQTYFKSASNKHVTLPSLLDILGVSLILTNVYKNQSYTPFPSDTLGYIFVALNQMSNTPGSRIVEINVGTPSINNILKILCLHC